jgi:hypothetical protein
MAPMLMGYVTTRFFLWGYIRLCLLHNLNELKTSISNITADISSMMMQALSMNMLHRAQLYMQLAGAHSQNVL